MEGVMKRFGLILLSAALIFAMSGCDPDDPKNPDTTDDNPVVNGVSYTKTGGTPTAITAGATINIDYNEEITLLADVDNGDTFSWVPATTGIVTFATNNALSVKVTGTAIPGGETEITFTANNGNLKDEFKFKIKVAPRPEEGLWLDVYKGLEKVINDDNFPIPQTDTTGLTFTAAAIEDEADVSARVTWAATPANIVTLSANTGGTVTITPLSVGIATITVEVKSQNLGLAYADKVVTFTVEVTKVKAENVLFEWNNSMMAESVTSVASGGSAPSYITFPAAKVLPSNAVNISY